MLRYPKPKKRLHRNAYNEPADHATSTMEVSAADATNVHLPQPPPSEAQAGSTQQFGVNDDSMKARTTYKNDFLSPTRKIPGCKFRLTISYACTKIAPEAVATVQIMEPGIGLQTMKRSRRIGKSQRLSTKRMLLSRTGSLLPKKSKVGTLCSNHSSTTSSPEPPQPLPNEMEALTKLHGWNRSSSLIVRKEIPVRICFDLDDVQVTKVGKYRIPMRMFDQHDQTTFYMSAREILDATKEAQDLGYYEVEMYCRVKMDSRRRCKMVQVRWTTGEISWEPMKQLLADDPVGLKLWLERTNNVDDVSAGQDETVRDKKSKRRGNNISTSRSLGEKEILLMQQELVQARKLLNNEALKGKGAGKPLSTDQWYERYSELKEFMLKYGHCRKPSNLNIEMKRLFIWVANQRQAYRCGRMDKRTERVKLLEDIGFRWIAQTLQKCDAKKTKCQSASVPAKKKKLQVCNVQSASAPAKKKRRISKTGAIDKVKVSALGAKQVGLAVSARAKAPALKAAIASALPDLARIRHYPIRDENWLKMFNKLKAYRDECGEDWTKRMPKCPKLRRWMYTQRNQYQAIRRGERSFLTQKRLQMLHKVGFAWVGAGQNKCGRPRKTSAVPLISLKENCNTSMLEVVLDENKNQHQEVPPRYETEDIKISLQSVMMDNHKTPQKETSMSTEPPFLVQQKSSSFSNMVAEVEHGETTSEEMSSTSSDVVMDFPKIQVPKRGVIVSDDDGTPRKIKLLVFFVEEGANENTNTHPLPETKGMNSVDFADMDSVALSGRDDNEVVDIASEITGSMPA